MAEPTIKIKRSSVPGKTPSTSNLSLGELGLNTYDGKVFLKQDQGGVGVGTTVITINPWGVGVGSVAYDTYFTAGNVGVGLTNPAYDLDVNGDINFAGSLYQNGTLFTSGVGIGSTSVNPGSGVVNQRIGVGFTDINIVGSGISVTGYGSTVVIDFGNIAGAGGDVETSIFSRTVTDFTATEGQTTFNISYTVGYVDVYVNGVYLDSSEYTASNGTSVVLTVAANAGDIVSIITYVTGGLLVSGVSDRTKTLVIAGAGQTEFTVDYTSDSYLDVYLNGAKLNSSEYTATDGTTVGLNTGASLNDEVEFIAYNPIYSDSLWSASNPGYGSTSDIYRLNSRVGIGTDDPDRLLHLGSTGAPVIKISDYDTGVPAPSYAEMSFNGGNMVFSADAGNVSGATRVAFEIDGDEKVRITSDGNVGIGTDDPKQPIHLLTSNPAIRLQDTGSNTSYAQVSGNGGKLYLQADDNNVQGSSAIEFHLDGDVKALINSNGNVGIGTDDPNQKLSIRDNVPSGTSNVFIYNAGGDGVLYIANDDQYSAGLGTLSGNGSYIELSGKWNSTNTAAYRTFGRIGAFKENNTSADGAGYVALYSRPNGDSLTEAIRIDSSQRVGIGTTNPSSSSKLHVIGEMRVEGGTTNVGGEQNLVVRSSSTNTIPSTISALDSDATLQIFAGGMASGSARGGQIDFIGGFASSDAGSLIFRAGTQTGGTSVPEAMRITSSRRVGIGTDNSSFKLQINSDVSDECRIRMEGRGLVNGDYTLLQVIGYASTQPTIARSAYIGTYKHAGILYPQSFIFLEEQDGTNSYFWVDNTSDLRISSTVTHLGTTSGTVVGDQTSDERLKDVLGEVPYGLEEVKNINPVRYKFKDNQSRERLGFIAQQVQPIIPESVYDTNDAIPEHEEEPTKLSMEYVSLIPVLVNAIKELSEKVDTLTTRLETLESSINT